MLVAAAAATALLTLVGTALAENYQYRFTKADEALAARIVHRPTTKGWTGGAAKPDLSADPVVCAGYYTPRRSDLVVTGDKEATTPTRRARSSIPTRSSSGRLPWRRPTGGATRIKLRSFDAFAPSGRLS